MRNASIKRLSAFVWIGLLSGCGGGGGGGGAPATATGIDESYYPVDIGARWVYDVSSSDSSAPFVDEMVITGTRPIGGATAWVFRESNPEGDGNAVESYYSKDARAYAFLGLNSSADWVSSSVAPIDLMRFDGTFSATPLFDRAGIDLGVDLDGDGVRERADARVNGTVEGRETLVTELGSFSNTVRLRYDVAITVRLSTGGSVPATQTLREWRAPQVGALRQSIQTSVLSETETVSLELTGLLVNGIVGGVLPLHDLLSGLDNAGSDETRPGRPALATDGQRYLLVTNKRTVSGRQWLGQFIDANGQLQTSIELSPSTDLWGPPAVAWNGANYLLITGGPAAAGMRAQRISAAGVILDAYPGSDLAPDGINRAVAGGAGTWLAVYRRTSFPGTLFGTTISDAGVAGSEFVIATGVADIAQPAVAFDGTNFLVAWEAGAGLADPAAVDIHAARVSPAGAVIGAPFVVTTAPEAQWWPQVACDPSNCLIAWIDRRNYPGQSYSFSPGPGDMYGALVTRTGTVLNGVTSTGGLLFTSGITANAGYPGLTFNGTEYVLAWSRGAYVNNPGGPTGIYAARISTSGVATPASPGLALSGPPPSAARYLYPTLASVSSGTLAVWVSNDETMGTSKSIKGAMVWPKLSR